MFPCRAEKPARRGGTWLLTVQPAKDRSRWAWSVEHSGGGGPTSHGDTNSHKFSMGFAERAADALDAADLSGPNNPRNPE